MNGLTPRILCAKTLIRCEQSGSYANLTLSAALRRAEDLSPADTALCTQLVQGVTERRLTLDACMAAHMKRPPEKLDPQVRCVLRCGIYELLYLRTPESAAVNVWTETVKRLKKTSAAGMVNAVLRSFLRSGKRIPLPKDETAALSVQYSVPADLIAALLADYDKETVTAFLENALEVPPVYVRRNTVRISDAAFREQYPAAEPVDAVPGAYILPRGHERMDSADFHVQDLASQLCCLALDPQPCETVLDVCAAPGGKSFTAAELMENRGQLLAWDLHENRAGLIRRGAETRGLTCISAYAGDARETDKPDADRVLCDVPCSGYGVLRRKPEIRYKSPAEAENLPDIQYAILEASARAVKPGGVLVYSTCTLLKRENEAVVEKFLAAHPEFTPEKPWQNIAALAPIAQEMTTLLPATLGSDGFFIAKMRQHF